MSYMLVRYPVKDFDQWKEIFDSAGDGRKAAGELHHVVYRDADDPNTITAMFMWDSIENAQKYSQNPDLKATMEKAGVAGPPSIYFFNEA